jgi:hypothetical protein
MEGRQDHGHGFSIESPFANDRLQLKTNGDIQVFPDLPDKFWVRFLSPHALYKEGSSRVSGGWLDQQLNQRTQQRFAPFSNVVNELEEPQVKG